MQCKWKWTVIKGMRKELYSASQVTTGAVPMLSNALLKTDTSFPTSIAKKKNASQEIMDVAK